MTAPEGPVAALTGKKMLRRRVLTAIGATGVAVSAGLFGRPNKAAAAGAVAPADPGRPALLQPVQLSGEHLVRLLPRSRRLHLVLHRLRRFPALLLLRDTG
jgi:hypothetical protein